MSRWLFDLGNTRLKCATLDDRGRLGQVYALPVGAGEVAGAIEGLLPAGGQAAFVASVAAPGARLELLQVLATRFASISLPSSTASCAGVRNGYGNPAQLGVDRFLALLAARDHGPGPWLVVGVGTALTVDLLDGEGRHRGGLIGPSPASMRVGLHHLAAHLPRQGGRPGGFADNTLDALASGCDWAALGLVQRSLAEAGSLLGAAPGLLLHGGGAAALLPSLPGAVHVPELVLLGLARWARLGEVHASR